MSHCSRFKTNLSQIRQQMVLAEAMLESMRTSGWSKDQFEVLSTQATEIWHSLEALEREIEEKNFELAAVWAEKKFPPQDHATVEIEAGTEFIVLKSNSEVEVNDYWPHFVEVVEADMKWYSSGGNTLKNTNWAKDLEVLITDSDKEIFTAPALSLIANDLKVLRNDQPQQVVYSTRTKAELHLPVLEQINNITINDLSKFSAPLVPFLYKLVVRNVGSIDLSSLTSIDAHCEFANVSDMTLPKVSMIGNRIGETLLLLNNCQGTISFPKLRGIYCNVTLKKVERFSIPHVDYMRGTLTIIGDIQHVEAGTLRRVGAGISCKTLTDITTFDTWFPKLEEVGEDSSNISFEVGSMSVAQALQDKKRRGELVFDGDIVVHEGGTIRRVNSN
ncbi:MAG TPA: hypothetical protein VD999_00480 [Vitreimonas sp.]|nr:hypothetical protein [Vitreimonas sp.]